MTPRKTGYTFRATCRTLVDKQFLSVSLTRYHSINTIFVKIRIGFHLDTLSHAMIEHCRICGHKERSMAFEC